MHRPKLAIVGNAEQHHDFSKQIDDCDIVIRFNSAATLGKNTGTKTDILCVRNVGEPTKRLIQEQSIKTYQRFPKLSEVWFPRLFVDAIDLSSEIIASNDLSKMQIEYFSIDMNLRLENELRRYNSEEMIIPSTGMLAIWYIVENDRFKSYDK
ncbi:MAG: SDR family oxidoreductase [Chitinophagales bacterium]|nr:SDR family oxidoreductase [Chitinophagales bacterium]